MQSKPWYKSKTIWANAVAVVLLVASYFGVEPVKFSGDQAAMVLAIVNFLLRLVTKQPIASVVRNAA